MQISPSRRRLSAVLLALALGATACGGSDDPAAPAAGGAGGGTPDPVSIYIGEPENALLPGNTTETEGGQVVDSLWTGLITYDATTNELEYEGVAETIEANEDGTVFTIRLKDGWTFHDGTPVTAQSYADSWNYTANASNAQGNSYFFERVEGYDDLNPDPDAAGNPVEPTVTEMSGLNVVDDLTLEVTLSAPFAQFPITLGYTAFFPYPEAAFEDIEAFGEQPVGNGPFMATEPLDRTAGITLTRFEDYAGPDPAQVEQIEYRIYTEVTTAYLDVQAGNLDVVDTVPPDSIGSAPDEFGDRFIESPYGDMTSLAFPTYDERFADPLVRQAISLAIDREAITEAIFQGSRTPATSWLSPVVDGHRTDACEYIGLDVERANALLDEAGFDRSQPVNLWFNGGAGHEDWMEAVGNQLSQNLGLTASEPFALRGELQQAEFLPLARSMGLDGPFRAAWVFDYPSPENFLAPIYSTAALPPGSNTSFYSNPEFDAKLAEGDAAPTNEEAVALYQEAEDILCQDMPSAPLFSRTNQSVHSERVDNVTVNAFGRVPASQITIVQ